MIFYRIGEINLMYRQISNTSHTFVGNWIVDHSDVVGAAPVGAAPSTSSFSTWYMASKDWAKTANCKTRRETFKFWDLVRLVLKSWRYLYKIYISQVLNMASEQKTYRYVPHIYDLPVWYHNIASGPLQQRGIIGWWLLETGALPHLVYKSQMINLSKGNGCTLSLPADFIYRSSPLVPFYDIFYKQMSIYCQTIQLYFITVLQFIIRTWRYS